METPEPAVYRPGSEADFERLYRDSYHRILGTLIVMLHDRATAEDCAQEAFTRAYANWSRWRPDAPAEAWLHRIAINTAISNRRRARLREVGEVIRRLGRPGPGPDPGEVASRSEVYDAMRSLPSKQTAVLVLRYYHGYSNREIAAALGVPEQTVASRLAAAKRKVRAHLSAAELATSG